MLQYCQRYSVANAGHGRCYTVSSGTVLPGWLMLQWYSGATAADTVLPWSNAAIATDTALLWYTAAVPSRICHSKTCASTRCSCQVWTLASGAPDSWDMGLCSALDALFYDVLVDVFNALFGVLMTLAAF